MNITTSGVRGAGDSSSANEYDAVDADLKDIADRLEAGADIMRGVTMVPMTLRRAVAWPGLLGVAAAVRELPANGGMRVGAWGAPTFGLSAAGPSWEPAP
ncbi:hypothetical protein F4556_004566 [Kitasatospora gansuensis]|uniref:Uncharacterized protein n=1 Tax=Kitasatospora gansuensis TaxID=258050 RepID=A0A7W7SGQ1_9ACTN|nr:hypothetical protein [Kitasatospora gansuensis]MBB4949031.1 hypothetical protein [Kitasatospora gansuensis]